MISLWLVGCICLLYLEKAFVYHTRKRHLFIVQVADIEHFFPRFTCFLFIFLSRLACKHFTACTTTSQHRPSYSGRTGNVCSLYRLCTFCCSCSMDTPFSLKKSLLLHCPLLWFNELSTDSPEIFLDASIWSVKKIQEFTAVSLENTSGGVTINRYNFLRFSVKKKNNNTTNVWFFKVLVNSSTFSWIKYCMALDASCWKKVGKTKINRDLGPPKLI